MVVLTTIFQVALHLLYLGMPLDRAINLPRLHHQLLPEELLCEEGLNKVGEWTWVTTSKGIGKRIRYAFKII